jgi:peptidoglycan/xylan/chitin deacetylase (PgdA/CDA1 family)
MLKNDIIIKNIFVFVFIIISMKKFFIRAFKVKKWAVNLSIVLTLAVVAISCFAFYPYTQAMSVSGVYYTGNKESNNVSLMINVYWGSEYIDDMLSCLKEKGVKATFFVGGTWAVMNEDCLKKIYDDGHEIANHGYHHKDHDKLDEKGNINEIQTTHKIIQELLGIEMNLFAPPSGAYDKLTVSCASSLGYKTIMWTRDTIDWRDHDQNLIYNRAIKNASGGDLILMHPTKETSLALPSIIDYFLSKNLNVTTVGENIGI